MNEQIPENIERKQQQKIIYNKVLECAEKLAELAEQLDGTLVDFNAFLKTHYKVG